MPPKLDRRRAEMVLSRIDAILFWETRHDTSATPSSARQVSVRGAGRTVLESGEPEVV
jgi:hypothetical protein